MTWTMIGTMTIKYWKYKALIGLSAITLTACDEAEKKPPAPAANTLTAPFDVFTIREQDGKLDAGKFTCKDTPTPMRDLFFESMYDDDSKNASVVDPEAHKKYLENTKSIKDLESGLTRTANRYLLSKPPRTDIAECVLRWLDEWAAEDALLGKSNHMGDFVRKWALSSIALGYIQIRDETGLDAKEKKQAEDWIRRLTKRVIDDFSTRTDKNSRNNNHMYWAAWGVTAAGIALNDRTFFDWGVERAREGITDIAADGTLPLEMARGPKAYNYHHYAAIPLFMIAHAAEKNGVDLYAENNQGLKRLARVLLENIEEPAYFEQKTGEKQNLERTVTRSNLSWLEPYYDHYHDPVALKWLTTFRPVKHSRVGGDATILYGSNNNQ